MTRPILRESQQCRSTFFSAPLWESVAKIIGIMSQSVCEVWLVV